MNILQIILVLVLVGLTKSKISKDVLNIFESIYIFNKPLNSLIKVDVTLSTPIDVRNSLIIAVSKVIPNVFLLAL